MRASLRLKQLHGPLPICAYCKEVRNDENYWQRVEEHVNAHMDARCSHGICPPCDAQILAPELRAMHVARAEEPHEP